MERPQQSEYAPYYAGYVGLVPEADILGVLEAQNAELRDLVASVPADRESYRYEPGKWSIREVLGHIGDGERVFGFRAFCFSRGETNPLPGFDEKEYVARSSFDHQGLAELIADFSGLRSSNLRMLRRLAPQTWLNKGTASGNPVSVRALAFILAGHVRHHVKVLRDRYGVVG
jgi:hypothetical protein